METGKQDPSTFFKDGVRKIDFVLVVEKEIYIKKKSTKNEPTEYKSLIPEYEAGKFKLGKLQRIDYWREMFIDKITFKGLEVEEEIFNQEDKLKKTILRLIKLHAPWSLLCQMAEDLNIEAPIREVLEHEETSENGSEKLFSALCLPNFLQQEIPNKPKKYYTKLSLALTF